MKADAPKRKIFDAVDLMTADSGVTETGNGLQSLPIDKIKPFHDHPFHLYEGERLDDMVESIREHGILNPVIVRKKGREYEMLAGHNRQNAARISGLTEIPAIVKTGLSDEEAYVYVIETNVMQRSFTDLAPSEKAAVLSARYEKVISQGRRNDILQEIEAIGTCGHDVHKSKSRDGIGEEYGMTGRNIARYMRVDKLIRPLKDKLDEGEMTLAVAVELSYLPEEEQTAVFNVLDALKIKLNPKFAETLRSRSGELNENTVMEVISAVIEKKPSADKVIRVKLPGETRKKYFDGMSSEKMAEIIEQALAAWFEGKEVEVDV